MKFSKSEAKEKIKELVDRFEGLSPERLKTINEADTRRIFILPLFRALGWDTYGDFVTNEVAEEETGAVGRVDYSFRINSITQFLLEAKAIPEDLDRDRWAHQAIEYGWNKGIPWVVLTDFEGLKVFNSEWLVDEPRANLTFSYKDYIEKFDRLWLLSRESFESNELDKLLSEFGITAKRVRVNEKLAGELVEWRGLLSRNLEQWNTEYSQEEIEESVQRILDRLIFIRVVEDRGLEEKSLWQNYQKWDAGKDSSSNFIETLIPLFREFDAKYNSNLFQEHLCEKLYSAGDPFRKIIPQLYGVKEKGLKYRFDAIDADVLGGVYEQYLGSVQKRNGNKSRRKRQGIYYTPTYVVNYIVRNTVGELLEEKVSLAEKEDIRILDPACGSGSFLTKSLEVLDEHFKSLRGGGKKDEVQIALRRYRILTHNLYGVDLDEQAIEIARLNLLLKALVPGKKLPLLAKHMKVGNSLIADREIANKAFRWEEEFSETIKNGGFDVIIGNPPYVQLSLETDGSEALKKYLLNKYESSMGRLNTFGFFIKLGIDLLKDGGYLGFIIPNTILTQEYYKELRKIILNSTQIKKIISFTTSPFKDAVVENVIIILKKDKNKETRITNEVDILNVSDTADFYKSGSVSQVRYLKSRGYVFSLNSDTKTLVLRKKIEKFTKSLQNFLTVNQGIALKHNRRESLSEKKLDGRYKQVLDGRDINRYLINWPGVFLKYDLAAIHSCKREDIFMTGEKIFFRRVGDKLIAALDDKQFYALNTLVVMNTKKNCDYNIRYFLALFNSKLMNFYYKNFLKSTKKVFSEIQARQVKQLPIRLIDVKDKVEKNIYNLLVNNVDELISLNKSLSRYAEGCDNYKQTKMRISKVEDLIDRTVYDLYGISKKDKITIESN